MTGDPKSVTHCHCSRCRKTRGTANATNLLLPGLDGLKYLAGEELLGKYHPPDAKYYEHWFCKTCGSTMPRFDTGRNFTVVPMGSFDDDPGLRPVRHIHVGSKAPWDDIHDDLPQFEAAPPAF
jgi:hypothetical protein